MASAATIAANLGSVENDVAAHLAASLGLVVGTDVFTGQVRGVSDNQSLPGAVKDRAVFVLLTGGLADVPIIDGGNAGREARPTVQIWVRGNPRDYDGGRTLSSQVYAAIDKRPPSGYFEARATSSAPIYVRQDDQEHHEWSINVTLKRWEP
jgi:hypothetical protein